VPFALSKLNDYDPTRFNENIAELAKLLPTQQEK
jgi:hypothetical protein